jgi:hypothetical protein
MFTKRHYVLPKQAAIQCIKPDNARALTDEFAVV